MDWEVKVQVAIQSIPVRKTNLIGEALWYVGTSGAEVRLEFTNADVIDYSTSQPLNVEHTNTLTGERKAEVKLVPEVKVQAGSGVKAQATLGSVSHGLQGTATAIAAYTSQERPLEAVHTGRSVRWTLGMPRGENVVRDFLFGTLALNAKCRWATDTDRGGYLEVVPADISFFDNSKRRILSRKACLLMRFELWKQGIEVRNPTGVKVEFKEVHID